MAAAVPLVLAGLSTGSQIRSTRKAGKAQDRAAEQQDKLLAEQRASTQQKERSAVEGFRRRRRTGGPGFSDVGAASLVSNTGGTSTALGA